MRKTSNRPAVKSGGARPGAGRPREMVDARTRTLTLDDATWQDLTRMARAAGVSRSRLVRDLVAERMDLRQMVDAAGGSDA